MDDTMLGGRTYQLRVADILDFADRLRELGTDPEAFIFDTQALRPNPVLGLQALIDISDSRVGQSGEDT